MTVPSSLLTTIADLANQLAAAMQQLSLLMRDRDSPQQPLPPATPQELDALAHHYSLKGIVLPQSYLAFLAVHNGWGGFSGDSHMLSTGDHASASVAAAIAERQGLNEDQHLSPLVPVLLGLRTSSLAGFLDPGTTTSDGECDVVLMDGSQLLLRSPGFLPFLEEWMRHLERAIRIQLEGDEP